MANVYEQFLTPSETDQQPAVVPDDSGPIGPSGESLNLPPNTGEANQYGGIPAPETNAPKNVYAQFLENEPTQPQQSQPPVASSNPYAQFLDQSQTDTSVVPEQTGKTINLPSQSNEPAKRPVGFFEAAGRAFPSGLASMNEMMAKGVGVFPYIEDKTLQAFGIKSDIYDRYMKAVHSTGLGEPTVEGLAIKPTEELTTGGKIGWGTSEMLSKLPYIAAAGAVGAEEAATTQAMQVIKPLMPRITQGIQSMLPLAAESGFEAVKESAKKGDEPIEQVAKGIAQATTTAVVGAVPLAMRSKISNSLLRVLEQGAYGYITGIPVAESQKVISSWINGEPYVPSEFKEMAIQAVPMALMTGAFGYFHSPQVKAKMDASVGGPEPKVNPSENSVVNEREAQILAGADAQASVPEGVVAEPTTTVAETKASETAPAPDLTSLILDQTLYDEGSAEWNAIQAQIDALNKPAEAPAEAQPTPTNAIQVTSATEAMLRPQGAGQGEVVELSGVGEQKPEVPAKEAEAPKEEVKPPLPKETKNEFLDFAKKQGGLTKAQAQKALAEYEKAGNITIGDNGEMLFTKPENSTRESLRKAAGIEEAPTASKSQPIRDLLRRFQSGEEDSIDTLKGLADSVSDLARKTKNKRLADLSSELEEAVSLGVEIEDAEKLVERSLAAMEDEAIMIDSPKKGKQSTRQKRTKKDKAREVFGNAVESLSQVLESKILDPIQYKRMVRSGMIEGGGEYDFFYNHKFPKKVRELIFSKTGERIDVVSDNMGFKDPTELLTAIDDAYRSAERINEETKALEKDQSDIEENFRKMEELKKTDPDAYAGAVEEDARTYLRNQLRREGGYTELPQIIYDAAVSVGRSVAKAARDFKSWSGEMVSRLGDGVKGYLRQIWGSIKGSWNKDIGGGFDTGGRSRERAMGEAERYGPKAPTEQEAFAKKASDAILKGRGTPITQEEMANILARKFPGISPAEVSDLYATASGKPKPSTAYAGGAAEGGGQKISLKNESADAEAKSLGLPELTQQDAQEMNSAMDRAKKKSAEDPLAAQRLSESLIANPKRSLTGDESALLLKHKTDLFNSLNRMADGLTEGSPEQKFEKSLAYDNASRSYYDLLQALKDRGSEWGREGRWRQALLSQDYTFATQERLAKAAKREPLTDNEKTELAKQTKRLTEIDKEILETQEKEANKQEQKSINQELKNAPQVDPYIQGIVDRIIKNVASAADAARDRVAQRRKERAGRLFTGVDFDRLADIPDATIIGADYLLKGTSKFAEWSSKMIGEFGEKIRPYLDDIFQKSKEFNEQQTDKESKGSNSVKKRVLKATSPEESIRKAQETRARNRLEELKKEEERQKNGDFSKPLKKTPIEPSAETKRLREEAAKIKDRINERRAKWEKANKTKIEKVLSRISALNRFNILSHITVLEHLAGASVENIVTRPISSTLAQVMRFNKTLNDIRKKAVYEGGFSLRSELKGVYGITKSAKDVWSKLLKGKASIDWLYGKQYNTAPQFVKMVENVHGAMKEPVRQGIFSRSLQLRIEAAKEMGLDPMHDEVLYNSLASEALNDANMDIFMGDNFLTSGIRGMIRGFERNTESPRLAKFISTLLDLAMPIMNVPTNIAIRKLRLGFGLIEAPARIAIAAKEGKLANRAEKLSRDEAEKITRAFKYGTLGLLLAIYAWRNSNQFGGLYNTVGPQAPENPELKKGEVKLLGLKFPKAISHGPVASFMNMIADARRLYEKSVRNNPNSKWSQLSEPTFFSLFVSGLGSLPPAQAATRYFSPFTTGGQKVGQALRDMLIPGAVQDIAKKMDTESQPKNFIDFLEGEPIKRSSKTFEQELIKGIPVLRQTLPKSKQKGSGGSRSGKPSSNKPFYKSDSSKPFYKK
jgi:hypothetical protein